MYDLRIDSPLVCDRRSVVLPGPGGLHWFAIAKHAPNLEIMVPVRSMRSTRVSLPVNNVLNMQPIAAHEDYILQVPGVLTDT